MQRTVKIRCRIRLQQGVSIRFAESLEATLPCGSCNKIDRTIVFDKVGAAGICTPRQKCGDFPGTLVDFSERYVRDGAIATYTIKYDYQPFFDEKFGCSSDEKSFNWARVSFELTCHRCDRVTPLSTQSNVVRPHTYRCECGTLLGVEKKDPFGSSTSQNRLALAKPPKQHVENQPAKVRFTPSQTAPLRNYVVGVAHAVVEKRPIYHGELHTASGRVETITTRCTISAGDIVVLGNCDYSERISGLVTYNATTDDFEPEETSTGCAGILLYLIALVAFAIAVKPLRDELGDVLIGLPIVLAGVGIIGITLRKVSRQRRTALQCKPIMQNIATQFRHKHAAEDDSNGA